jgi:two-component system response regulator YesN
MKRILIVDDENLICKGLAQRIENSDGDWAVSKIASNGFEALEWLKHHYADICITDVKMPIMGGMELIQNINIAFPWMAIIVVSSHDDFSFAQRSIKLGAIDYLLKPINGKLLIDALNSTVTKLNNERIQQTYSIFFQKLSKSNAQYRLWLDRIQNRQFFKMPLLIIDTLELMERWVEDRFILLPHLAQLWVDSVATDLQIDRKVIESKQLKVLPEWMEATVTFPKLRFISRLMAVGVMENYGFERIEENRISQNRYMVEMIKLYINENYMKSIHLKDIGRYVGTSRTYLTSIFKHETSMNIWAYIHAVRMQKARELLLGASVYRVYEIAAKVGYGDTKYFSQLFKDHYGTSPHAYKKIMENHENY